MRRKAGEGGDPGVRRPICGLRNAAKRRNGVEDRVFRVRFVLEILDEAECGADKGRRVVSRIGRGGDMWSEGVIGARRVDDGRKDGQQRDQHQKDLRKAAMEAGLTQNEPLST